MGISGAVVMSFFGAVFAAATLLLQFGVRGPALGSPFAVFAGIAIAATSAGRLPGPGFVRPPRAGRAMLWSSVGEGLALAAIGTGLQAIGRSDLLLPTMAVVVGLHFVPIAYWSPFPPLYPLAAVIAIAGAVGLMVGQPRGGAIAGFTAAAALAVASVAAIRRERRAKRLPAA